VPSFARVSRGAILASLGSFLGSVGVNRGHPDSDSGEYVCEPRVREDSTS